MAKHDVKKEVEWCLKERPATRESDKMLWISVCYNFYYLGIRFPINDLRVFTDLIMSYPSEDAIKRYRAQFNNKGLYLPQDEKVLKARKLLEKEWKEEKLDYPTAEQVKEIEIQKHQEKMELKYYWQRD